MSTRALDLLNELEWRRCQKDPEYFVSQFCWIHHPDGPRLIPMRDVQREILSVWEGNRATVSLKARQIGWSTMSALYSLWVTMYGEGRTVIILSRGQEFARDVLAKATFAYDRLPSWMQERVGIKNRTLEKLVLSNGSLIESLPSKKDPARGKTAHTLFADEFAFFDDPAQQWPSLLPVVDVGGSLHILSSANGSGTFFEDLYVDAKEGRNRFKAMFYSWRCVPERTDEWYEEQKLELNSWQLHQEYPSNDVEAFIRSGSPVFDVDRLMATEMIEPTEGELLAMGSMATFAAIDGGPMDLFQDSQRGSVYVIGADTARGLEFGDYSCATVLRLPEDGGPMVHVATLHGTMDPDVFGEAVMTLGRYYNDALVGVESNNHGISTLMKLRDGGYKNLFYRRVVGQRREKRTREMGWHTNKKSKPLMMDDLSQVLRTGELEVRCKATRRELMAYRRSASGEMHGSPHDDRVVAMAIAVQMLNHVSKRERSAEEDKPVPFSGQWLLDQVGVGKTQLPDSKSWLQSLRGN